MEHGKPLFLFPHRSQRSWPEASIVTIELCWSFFFWECFFSTLYRWKISIFRCQKKTFYRWMEPQNEFSKPRKNTKLIRYEDDSQSICASNLASHFISHSNPLFTFSASLVVFFFWWPKFWAFLTRLSERIHFQLRYYVIHSATPTCFPMKPIDRA